MKGDRLQTTVEKLGIVVLYERVLDERQLGAIEARVEQQKDSEAHHKDEDFWHTAPNSGAQSSVRPPSILMNTKTKS